MMNRKRIGLLLATVVAFALLIATVPRLTRGVAADPDGCEIQGSWIFRTGRKILVDVHLQRAFRLADIARHLEKGDLLDQVAVQIAHGHFLEP